jgi:RsiW-degrading membrane proteinase PrsW (M82 family)
VTAAEAARDELTRREAIDVSGWGARFRLVQPRNACFWVYLALVGTGIRHVVGQVTPTAGVFAQADVLALLTSGLFCAVFLMFLHWADRWERTPAGLAVAAFLAGGFGSTFAIAITGNAAVMSLYAKLLGQAFAADWKAGLTAPFVEETAKGAAFLLVMGLAPVVVRTVYDGLIVGAYTGLGFQVVEDMLYGQNAAAANFGANQAESVLDTFVQRAITGIASHALYTALFGAGLIYLLGTVAQPRRPGRGLLLVLAAVVFHGVWDSAAALGGGGVLVLPVLVLTTVLAVVALFVALRLGGGREREFMRAILAPEVRNGTLGEGELDAVVGGRRERRAAVRHRPDGMSRRREKHVVRAARDLAGDLADSGGADTPQVGHARAEIARLRGR